MAPLKMWGLLPIAVLLLLTISPTLAEVVQSMTQCGDFLLNNELPQVPGVLEKGQIQDNQYKVICQTFNNVKRFVTLYDTKNKIPVFSAAKFTGAEEGRPTVSWKIEPQLENSTNGKNMEPSRRRTVYKNQASNNDYECSRYDRGHLFPSSYANHEEDQKSTFTLTNAVPLVISFNRGSWARMETCVKDIMKMFCINNNNNIEGYVMIGAKPSDRNTINNRVNVPSLLWSTFCCYSNKLGRWIASGSWGENVSNMIPHIETMEQLNNELSNGGKRFNAFPGSNCPQDQTIDDLYSQLPGKANCFRRKGPRE